MIESLTRVVFINEKAKRLYSVRVGDEVPADTQLYSATRFTLEQQKRIAGLPMCEHSDGKVVSLTLYAYPLPGSETNPSLLVILCDNNPLHQYYETRISQEKLTLIGDMAAATADIILNPLAVIKGILQLIEQSLHTHIPGLDAPVHPMHKKIEHYFQTAYDQVKAIDGHLQRFLLLGKPAKIPLTCIRVISFLQEFMPLVQMKALENKVRLICEYPHIDGQILGHLSYFKEALLALLENAFEATEQGEAVTFRVEMTKRTVYFTIIDYGSGIPPDLIPHMKAPFVTTKDKALGLGLSYSDLMIDKMGGTLNISPLQEGVKVQVRLPRID